MRLLQSCFAFTCLILAISFNSCDQNQPADKEEIQQDTLVFEIHAIDSSFSHKEMKYELLASLEQDSIIFCDSTLNPQTGNYSQEKDTLIIRNYPLGITLKIYSDSLQDTIILKAKKAVYRSQSGTFEFSNDVQMSFGRDTIFTERITFTESNRKYTSEGFVHIKTSKGEILNAEGFIGNENFTKYELKTVISAIHLKDLK